jgi:hypothetical protein
MIIVPFRESKVEVRLFILTTAVLGGTIPSHVASGTGSSLFLQYPHCDRPGW